MPPPLASLGTSPLADHVTTFLSRTLPTTLDKTLLHLRRILPTFLTNSRAMPGLEQPHPRIVEYQLLFSWSRIKFHRYRLSGNGPSSVHRLLAPSKTIKTTDKTFRSKLIGLPPIVLSSSRSAHCLRQRNARFLPSSCFQKVLYVSFGLTLSGCPNEMMVFVEQPTINILFVVSASSGKFLSCHLTKSFIHLCSKGKLFSTFDVVSRCPWAAVHPAPVKLTTPLYRITDSVRVSRNDSWSIWFTQEPPIG